MYIGLQVKCQLLLPDLNEIWIFSTDFRKILKYQISFKSVQWQPSCSMRTDRQTDMMKLTVAFRNFAKASTKRSGKKKRRCIAMSLTEVTTRLSRMYSCTILNLGSRKWWVVNATPRPLYTRETDVESIAWRRRVPKWTRQVKTQVTFL